MSSSKVFKDDPAFTPVSLISEEQSPPMSTTTLPEGQEKVPSQETQPHSTETVTLPPEQSPPPEETSPPPPAPDLEVIRAEAYEQGRIDAEQAIQKEVEQTIEAFSLACKEIDNQHKALLEQSRGDMINLVMALCKKIIGRELTTGRNIIVDTLKNAVELAIKDNEYDIWINPEDLATVEELVPELIGSVQKLEHVTLKTDPNITPGGCRLDSSICTVDATIEAQLETVRDFLDEKGPESSEPDLREIPYTDTEAPPEEQ